MHILSEFNSEVICVSVADEWYLLVLAVHCTLQRVKHEGSQWLSKPLAEHPKQQTVSIPAGCQGIYFGQEREALWGTASN